MARASDRSHLKNDPELEPKLRTLGELLCTTDQVALAMNHDPADMAKFLVTFEKARTAFNEGRVKGIKALKRAQLKLAETSVTMAIFLGKTELGQSERRELDLGDAIDLSEAGRRAEERLAALIAVAPEADADEAEGGVQDAP
jgi:hypothetical protein